MIEIYYWSCRFSLSLSSLGPLSLHPLRTTAHIITYIHHFRRPHTCFYSPSPYNQSFRSISLEVTHTNELFTAQFLFPYGVQMISRARRRHEQVSGAFSLKVKVGRPWSNCVGVEMIERKSRDFIPTSLLKHTPMTFMGLLFCSFNRKCYGAVKKV